MKLKDLFSTSVNKKNNQSIWNPKKNELKKRGMTEKDLLEINLKDLIKK